MPVSVNEKPGVVQNIQRFAVLVRELFPNCPTGRDQTIAEHACQKYHGRVGRSASAKSLDEKAVLLAVTPHIRHAETNYDQLLSQGMERWDARDQVNERIDEILDRWRKLPA